MKNPFLDGQEHLAVHSSGQGFFLFHFGMIQLSKSTTFMSNVVEESLNHVESPIYCEKRRYIAKNGR